MLSLLEKVLGAGIKRAHENYYFDCPKCKHHKPKLNINLNENSTHYQNYNCFVCGWKGKTIYSLFKSLQVPNIFFEKLNQLTKNNYTIPETEKQEKIQLPE
jgi:transcription elongation factor Elf1